ncbi:MAG TPA: ABC transporter ATP-binding protein [Thermoanaerobaculia bacterium]|nr:ABC transporter ATP-binding protein [Thermoanaerobaculia bacterium]
MARGGGKLLAVRDVHKRFATTSEPVEVLRGISFELGEREALAITGPSGSGKSTLLHLIGSLDRPSAGTIEIGGTDPFALPEPELAWFRNRTIGFVFQDPHLLPQYTVLENVLVPALAFPGRGMGTQAAQDRAAELLARVGLGHRLTHRPAELSGGERQRAAVARALLNRPALLLCDEPTGSLDRAAAATVADLLFELHEAEGTILIAVTHSLDLAARFARRFELVEGRCAEPFAA